MKKISGKRLNSKEPRSAKKKLNFDIKIQGKITNSKKVESEKKFKNQINMDS